MVGRLFVAVPLTDEARHALAGQLSEVEIPGRPVPPQNWHLTLRFLGQVDEVAYDRLLMGLGELERPDRFGVRFGSLGAFPNPRRATVLWVDTTEGSERLADLAAGVEDALEGAGFPRQDRPFRSHLTLARIRPPGSVEPLLSVSVSVPMEVERVVVYRSHLGKPHARYEELESFPLS